MAKRIILICLVVTGLLASAMACYAASEVGITVGKKVPTFSLAALDGHKVSVGPTNRVTIINFWATWCPPCRGEMPELNDFYLQYKGKIYFYAVNLQEDSNHVNTFMYSNGYSLPTLLDSDNAVANMFQIQFIPTTIVVDRYGIIKYVNRGAISKQTLEGQVNPLL